MNDRQKAEWLVLWLDRFILLNRAAVDPERRPIDRWTPEFKYLLQDFCAEESEGVRVFKGHIDAAISPYKLADDKYLPVDEIPPGVRHFIYDQSRLLDQFVNKSIQETVRRVRALLVELEILPEGETCFFKTEELLRGKLDNDRLGTLKKLAEARLDAMGKGMAAEKGADETEVKSKQGEPRADGPQDGEWSRPMPLTDIADRLLKDSRKYRKVKSNYGDRLKRVGDKSWSLRLDGLPPNQRKEMDRP